MNRLSNLLIALFSLIIAILPIGIISLLIKLTSRGPVFHWSKRIGKNNLVFLMPKFRTMKVSTPQLATHLFHNSDAYLTPVGSLLRKSSLDELPQLWSILRGDMYFVGPRPALFNQEDLIEMRTKNKVHLLTPGITGYAQINGRDSISIEEKVKLDTYYFLNRSMTLDLEIIIGTIFKIIKMANISH